MCDLLSQSSFDFIVFVDHRNCEWNKHYTNFTLPFISIDIISLVRNRDHVAANGWSGNSGLSEESPQQ